MSNAPPPEHRAWQSYDSVTEAYERVAVPWFAPMVRDLLSAVAPPLSARLLDVGSGTGLVAGRAAATIGPGGLAVGLDPSVGMLTLARRRRALDVVAGMAPGLPFAGAAFDTVVAHLVLSHLPDLQEGLADMVRVLRPGGRLGGTAWGPVERAHPGNQQVEAGSLLDAAIAAAGLDAAPAVSAVPWEDHLRHADHVEEALHSAGLTRISIRPRTYHWTFTVNEFVSGWGSRSRYLRHIAGNDAWPRLQEEARAALEQRFGERISAINHLWVATADKP